MQKSNREKLDQKEAGAAELPAGKHLEQPAESVYTKAPVSIFSEFGYSVYNT